MKKIKVMLVDDSPTFLGILQIELGRDPEITVAGTAHDGQRALEMVPQLRPDVILCDAQMPKITGIEFLKRLLPKYPIPVVIVSGTPGITLTALQNGAVDFISKPAAGEPREVFLEKVITTVKTAASANVGAKTALRPTVAPAPGKSATLLTTPRDAVVAIGASTGGTDAILAVVRNLPANCPGVVATQHMPAGFTEMYASRLNKECKLQVMEAKDGQRLQTGQMLLAAGEHHLRIKRDAQGYYVSSRRGDKVSGHVPSVDVLFASVAEVVGNRAIGVILTGMGADGSEGLLQMRKAGAYTIGQDKASSVVYGMPMVAFNKGAVANQLPLDQITGDIVRRLNGMR